jgi:hypothetical protein
MRTAVVVSGFPEAGETRANWHLSVIKSRIMPRNHKHNNKTKNLRAPISPSNGNVTNLRTLRAAHKNAQQIYKWTRTFWYDALHVQTVLKLKQHAMPAQRAVHGALSRHLYDFGAPPDFTQDADSNIPTIGDCHGIW